MKFIYPALWGCLVPALVQAQRFGGNPPSVQWRQVNTPVARIIFPAGLDTAALQVEAIAERLNQATLPTIGAARRQINIVFQPNTTVSNAYVALAPFRSEFYLTPPQNSFELGSLPWTYNLAIHEYRHVQQYNNFNTGLSKMFRVLFGQGGQELANALSVPNWFWEGDAVFQETLVSPQGRGRLPSFFDDYRSLWLAGKEYSWMKLRNGSLKDFTPDHYRLGYMLVAYGREKYGDDFWRKVSHDAAGFRGLFYPFQRAVRRYSGQSFPAFYTSAIQYFKEQGKSASVEKPGRQHFLGNQEFPVFVGYNRLLYVNSSYRRVAAFIIKEGTREWKLRTRDVSLDNQFSYNHGKLVYAAVRPAIRWNWTDYSEIKLLDIASGRQRTLTHRSKYFSPDIDPAGNTLVAVAVNPGGASRLHLLNAATGALIRELPDRDSLFYTYPKFVNGKQVVAAVRAPDGKMALALVSVADGNMEYLTPLSYRVIGPPSVADNTIFFTASGNSYDELYAITLANKKLFHLSVATKGVGIYQPVVNNGQLVFTTFTASGYRLQEAGEKDIRRQPVSEDEWTAPLPQFNITALNGKQVIPPGFRALPADTVKKYPKGFQLFNFHSLIPYASDPDYTLSVVGNNVLNTMQSELFFDYNRNEGFKQFGANAVYGGWFPYVDAGANYIVDRKDFLAAGKPIYWNEAQFNAGLGVPLNLSRSRSLTRLSFGADYIYKSIAFQGQYKDSFASRSLGYVSSYLSFTHQLQQARQQIYPRFAQTVFVRSNNALQSVTARQLLAGANFYWPGLFANHSFVINFAWQHRDTLNQYRYTNSFPFSRGYSSASLRNMYKWGLNYHLPLLYPDLGFANLVYFLRVRGNLFYDNTVGKVAYTNGMRVNTDFRSTGGEIFFDTKWWNELPVSFGFRYSYLLDPDLYGGTGSSRFEFVLPVNLVQR